jgi:hypothetical protein
MKPIVLPPVIDGLDFGLRNYFSPVARAEQVLKLHKRIDKAIAAGLCKRVYVKSRYKRSFKLCIAGAPLIQVDPISDRQKSDIRVDINPSKTDIKAFHKIMRSIFGKEEYYQMMKYPLLNGLHAALDIQYVKMRYVIVRYKGVHELVVFGNKYAGGQTYNFGSITSAFRTAAYDKSAERRYRAALALATGKTSLTDDPMRNNRIKELVDPPGRVPTMRVEVRGIRMHGIALHELGSVQNRFARFQFAVLEEEEWESSMLVHAFRAMCQIYGVKATLSKFKGTKQGRAMRRLWDARQADWWKPDLIWSQVPDALRATKLFPPSAFGHSS